MNNSTRLPAIALAAGMALSMVFAPPARAADCANPQGTGMARACAKADDGTNDETRDDQHGEGEGDLRHDQHGADPVAADR